MKCIKQILLLCIFAIFASQAFAVTDTVYVQKRITDTLYVVSPPDTVYIQEEFAAQTKSETEEAQKNPYLLEYSTDTIAPGNKFYVGGMTVLSVFSIWFGAAVFDFYYEIENAYRGSYMFNIASIMLFDEYRFRGEERTWVGFRSIVSPGFGYRQYLFTTNIGKTNPKKLKLAYRNTPLLSFSLYAQALCNPSLKIANDKKYGSPSPKKWSFDAGLSASATLGYVWNLSNMLWDMGISVGYQYWSDHARKYLDGVQDRDGVNYHFLNGWSAKGFFFGVDYKLGF